MSDTATLIALVVVWCLASGIRGYLVAGHAHANGVKVKGEK